MEAFHILDIVLCVYKCSTRTRYNIEQCMRSSFSYGIYSHQGFVLLPIWKWSQFYMYILKFVLCTTINSFCCQLWTV